MDDPTMHDRSDFLQSEQFGGGDIGHGSDPDTEFDFPDPDLAREQAGEAHSLTHPFPQFEMPDEEELDADDWKILFMILCENRGHLDLEKGLTAHGKTLLKNVKRKIGINAVGVDIEKG
jgi:hypothetical protein